MSELIDLANEVLTEAKEFRDTQPHAIEIADYLDQSRETRLAKAFLSIMKELNRVYRELDKTTTELDELKGIKHEY